MLNRKMNDLMARRSNAESGFTLIELLVVMIIIGILAAIAIPAFMNQQKGARDTQTTSDVKNIATSVQTGLVQYPDARYFAVANGPTPPAVGGSYGSPAYANNLNNYGKINLWVGNSRTDAEYFTVILSKGTRISIERGTVNGTFILKGWNTTGKNYITYGTGRTYDSNNGGLQ